MIVYYTSILLDDSRIGKKKCSQELKNRKGNFGVMHLQVELTDLQI